MNLDNLAFDPLLIGISAVAFLIGGLLAALWLGRRLSDLRARNAELTTTLELERRAHEEKIRTLKQAQDDLSRTFEALSARALAHNNKEFLRLARENLEKLQQQAGAELEKKEKAIEHLVQPIRAALEKTEQQIRNIEKERKEAYGALTQHLQTMAQTQANLQAQTQNLVQALRRPEVRGQWGELTLKRLAELAGMVEHCDFFEQETVQTEEGLQRPDMIVRLPDSREIVVDVKTPLDAYLSAIEASDDTEREAQLVRHARNVRQRVNELASKAYWSQFPDAPDFVVLFIPGDQFLAAALDQDHELLEEALRQQVILATPTSFVALLRAVAFGWRQEQLAQNAEKIREVGEELYRRLLTFTGHLEKLGRSLDTSVKHYNKAVGSFDSRVLPGAQKFTEMGIEASKKLEGLEQVETGPRTPADREDNGDDAED